MTISARSCWGRRLLLTLVIVLSACIVVLVSVIIDAERQLRSDRLRHVIKCGVGASHLTLSLTNRDWPTAEFSLTNVVDLPIEIACEYNPIEHLTSVLYSRNGYNVHSFNYGSLYYMATGHPPFVLGEGETFKHTLSVSACIEGAAVYPGDYELLLIYCYEGQSDYAIINITFTE